MLCNNCGGVIDDKTNICSSCGKNLKKDLPLKILNVITRIILLLLIAIPIYATYVGFIVYQEMRFRGAVVYAIEEFRYKASDLIKTKYLDLDEMPADFDTEIKTDRISSVKWIRDTKNTGTIVATLSNNSSLGPAANQTVLIEVKVNRATYYFDFTCKKGTINPKYLPSLCKE